MPTFDFRFLVEASLPAVREFHHDTRALKRLTPPPTLVQLHEVEPLGEGSVSRFTLWVGPLPLRWTAVHRDVSQTGFTDIQAEGPARRWEHTHRFTAISPQLTEIHEHIEFEHKSGFWGGGDAIAVRLPEPVADVHLAKVRHAILSATQRGDGGALRRGRGHQATPPGPGTSGRAVGHCSGGFLEKSQRGCWSARCRLLSRATPCGESTPGSAWFLEEPGGVRR